MDERIFIPIVLLCFIFLVFTIIKLIKLSIEYGENDTKKIK